MVRRQPAYDISPFYTVFFFCVLCVLPLFSSFPFLACSCYIQASSEYSKPSARDVLGRRRQLRVPMNPEDWFFGYAVCMRVFS